MTDAELLDDLFDELLRGKVYECTLRSSIEGEMLNGLQDKEYVYIDPRPAILETLLHELLHRRKPRLSERTVDATAKRLLLCMDPATLQRWWRKYQSVKKKGRPVDA